MCHLLKKTFFEALNLSLFVSKPDFLYVCYSLSLFCIAEIISKSNQALELLAFTLTSFDQCDRIDCSQEFIYKSWIRSNCTDTFQVVWKMDFLNASLNSSLLYNVSLTRQVFRYIYEILVVMLFVCKIWGNDRENPDLLHPTG